MGERNPSNSSREELLEAYTPMVKALARTHDFGAPGSVLSEDDLFQEGIIALFHAMDKYDDDRGMSFSNYARHTVRYGILDAITASDHLSHRDRVTVRKLGKVREAFLQSHERMPSTTELAEESGVNLVRVREVLGADTRMKSAFYSEPDENVTDRTVGSPEDSAMEEALRAATMQALDALPARDRGIVVMRLIDGAPVAEVARKYEITPGRVSQITDHAKRIMAEALISLAYND